MRNLFDSLHSECRQAILHAVCAAFNAGVRTRVAVGKWLKRG